MKFDYKKITLSLFRPIIPIEVGHNDFFINYEVLVDSGADLCIFDAEIGELLGLKIESGQQSTVAGIAGSEIYYLHPISIKVGGHPFKITAGFLRGFKNRFDYGVVGQTGFFDKFIVKFDFNKQQIELKSKQ